MKINITYKNFELSNEDRTYVEGKLLGLAKFFDRVNDEAASASVTLLREKHLDHKDKMIIRAVISVPRADFRAENASYSLLEGMDAIVSKFKKQFEHFKTRHSNTKSVTIDTMELPVEEVDEPVEFEITKRKVFSNLIPMSEQTAIATMKALGHGFFLFVNEQTNQYNFVYKRPNDSGYGLIELLTSDGVL